MAEWISFIHAPRDHFADTMTDEEQAVWAVHFERFGRLLALESSSSARRSGPSIRASASSRRPTKRPLGG